MVRENINNSSEYHGWLIGWYCIRVGKKEEGNTQEKKREENLRSTRMAISL